MDVKWTRENHTVLYKRIVDAFGPHEKWNGADYPYGARYELEEIYKRFAKEMTDKGYPTTWTAVRNQVLWGITKQDGFRAIDSLTCRNTAYVDVFNFIVVAGSFA